MSSQERAKITYLLNVIRTSKVQKEVSLRRARARIEKLEKEITEADAVIQDLREKREKIKSDMRRTREQARAAINGGKVLSAMEAAKEIIEDEA